MFLCIIIADTPCFDVSQRPDFAANPVLNSWCDSAAHGVGLLTDDDLFV